MASRRFVAVEGLTDGKRSWVRLTVNGESVIITEESWQRLPRAKTIRFSKNARASSSQTTHVRVSGFPIVVSEEVWDKILWLVREGYPREQQYLLYPKIFSVTEVTNGEDKLS